MSPDEGRPERKRPAPPQSQPSRNQTNSSQPTAQPRQCAGVNTVGRYAQAWREGFRRGARDALRCAARDLPPETWSTLEALADQYELVSND